MQIHSPNTGSAIHTIELHIQVLVCGKERNSVSSNGEYKIKLSLSRQSHQSHLTELILCLCVYDIQLRQCGNCRAARESFASIRGDEEIHETLTDLNHEFNAELNHELESDAHVILVEVASTLEP